MRYYSEELTMKKSRRNPQGKREEAESKPWLAECGDPGFHRSAGLIDEEFHKDLKGIKAQKKYREMADNSSVLGTSLWLIEALIRQVVWTTQSNKSGHPQAGYVRDRVDEAYNDMESHWQMIVAELTTANIFGWASVEPTYKLRKGYSHDPILNSKYDDGHYGWRDWSPRAQESRDRWEIDKSGRMVGWWQRPPHDYSTRFLPIDRLIHFTPRRRKGNPAGYSLLRVPYVSYFYASRETEIEAIGFERQTAGMPHMQVPSHILHAKAGTQEAAIRAKWEDFVKKIRIDANYGALTPCSDLPDGKKSGFKFELVSASGRNNADGDPIIRRHESRMAMSFFCQFLLLGQDKSGSWALHSDSTHMLAVALGAYLKTMAELCDSIATPRLCRLNGWPSETYPTRVPGDIEKQSIAEAGAFVSSLLGSGGMRQSDQLNDWAYRMIGEEPPDEPDLLGTLREAEEGIAPEITAEPIIPDQPREPEKALTGIQISSLKEIMGEVASGLLPLEAGLQLIMTSFQYDRGRAERLLSAVQGSGTAAVALSPEDATVMPQGPPAVVPEPIEAADDGDEGPSEFPEAMTADEAADMLRVSKGTIHRAIASGKLPGTKLGNQYRILRTDLMRWLEASPAQGGNSGVAPQ